MRRSESDPFCANLPKHGEKNAILVIVSAYPHDHERETTMSIDSYEASRKRSDEIRADLPELP